MAALDASDAATRELGTRRPDVSLMESEILRTLDSFMSRSAKAHSKTLLVLSAVATLSFGIIFLAAVAAWCCAKTCLLPMRSAQSKAGYRPAPTRDPQPALLLESPAAATHAALSGRPKRHAAALRPPTVANPFTFDPYCSSRRNERSTPGVHKRSSWPVQSVPFFNPNCEQCMDEVAAANVTARVYPRSAQRFAANSGGSRFGVVGWGTGHDDRGGRNEGAAVAGRLTSRRERMEDKNNNRVEDACGGYGCDSKSHRIGARRSGDARRHHYERSYSPPSDDCCCILCFPCCI